MEIIGFRLPSKSGLFQEDLYPPFPSQTPSSDFDTWKAGTDKPPIMMELRPEKSSAKNKKKAGGLAARLAGKSLPVEEEKKEPAGGDDVASLQAEIARLKAQLAAGGSTASASTKEDLSTKPVLGYWAIRGLAA